jgi:hypothetical protein
MKDAAQIRIYVDFNSRDENGEVVINTWLPEMDFLNRELKEKMHVILFDETLEVDAEIKRNEKFGYWMAVPDWDTIHHLS